MVKIPQITTSNDEVSLSRHPHCQCNTLWPQVNWMLVNFHSQYSYLCYSHILQVIKSCACALHLLPCSIDFMLYQDELITDKSRL